MATMIDGESYVGRVLMRPLSHAGDLRKPCHDLLYISGAFRRLYPVGTNAKSMSCWTENARRAERLSAWGR